MMDKNYKLALNVLILCFRTLLYVAISLFIVRVLLVRLGITNYGIYNLVTGVVTAISFFSSSLATACQRFFSFELGKNNMVNLNRIFSLSLTVFLIASLLIIILSETAGLWFLNTQLTIPPGQMKAVNVVYQFSIASFIASFLAIPYNSMIVAFERMKVYAYISIFEVSLKLAMSCCLVYFASDIIEWYSFLILCSSVAVSFTYMAYCKQKFKINAFTLYWDKDKFKEFTQFSGWNIFGSLTAISFDQGINFLLNIFFGPVINASRAIAANVNNAITQFYSNLYTAVRPRIIKSYAEGNHTYVTDLVFKASKYSYFLLLLCTMPLLLETHFILSMWLIAIPAYTLGFIKLTVLFSLVNSLQIPLTTAVQATGVIKKYQIVVGIVMLTCLPVSFVLLKLNFSPLAPYYAMTIISCIAIFFRLKIMSGLIAFSFLGYFKDVVLKIILVSVIGYVFPFSIMQCADYGLARFIFVCIASFTSILAAVFFIGLHKNERKNTLNLIAGYLNKNKSTF